MGEVFHAQDGVPQENGIEFADNNTAFSADALQDWREQAGVSGPIPQQRQSPAVEATGHSSPIPSYMAGEVGVRRRMLIRGRVGPTALPGYFDQHTPFEAE